MRSEIDVIENGRTASILTEPRAIICYAIHCAIKYITLCDYFAAGGLLKRWLRNINVAVST